MVYFTVKHVCSNVTFHSGKVCRLSGKRFRGIVGAECKFRDFLKHESELVSGCKTGLCENGSGDWGEKGKDPGGEERDGVGGPVGGGGEGGLVLYGGAVGGASCRRHGGRWLWQSGERTGSAL